MLPKLQNYLQSPVHQGWVNFNGHPDGTALDIGWRTHLQNYNQDLFGLGEMKVIDKGWLSDGGNTVTLGANYDKDWDVWLSVMHMQYETPLSMGQVIGRSTKIGNMGNTGISHGEHVHIRLTFVKKGTPFSWVTYNSSKRYNPYDYIYQTSGMDVIDMKKMPNDWVNDGLDFINESGTITVIEPQGMVMRSYPSRKDGKVVGGLSKGQSMKYNRKVANDGFMWVTDGKVYVASRKLDYSEIFVNVDGKPIAKPNGSKPKPQEELFEGRFKVGQKIEFSTRYKSHHQDEIIEQGKMFGYIIHIYPKDKYQLAVSNTKGGKQNGATKPVNVFRIIG
mgnify:CR=1 FL=1